MQSVAIRILSQRNYQLVEDVTVETNKYKIFIAKGMVFNGADIPEAMFSLIGCPMDFALESLVHDAMYRSRVISRYEADNIFYELLLQQGVNSLLARKMYLAVRIGGYKAYEDAIGTMAEYRDFVAVMPKHDIIQNKRG